MNEKQIFMPRNIYFGRLTYNTYSDGYYVTSIEAFEKFITDSEEIMYRKIKAPNKKFKKYVPNTNEYLTVSELCPLTALIDEEKHNKPMSIKMINLYLLKHQVKEMLKKRPKAEIDIFRK